MTKYKYYWCNRAHYTDLITKRIRGSFWKLINYISAMWWGVEFGKNCHFIGKTHFERLQEGTITIGSNCTFNSTHTSNLAG